MKSAVRFGLFAAMAFIVLAATARATPVSSCTGFLSVLNVGDFGSGETGNFGDVCVTLISGTEAKVTFDANTAGGFGFVAANAADVNTSVAVTPGIVSITGSGLTDLKGFGSGNVSSFGSFDVTMDLKDASTSESEIVYTLTRSSGTWLSAADVLSADAKGFDAAAHVRCDSCSIAGATGMTFFVGETVVPEPTSLIVLGVGLAGLIYRRRLDQKVRSDS